MTAGLETHRDVVPLASAYPYASSVEFLNVKKCMPCDMWHAITSLKYLDTLLLYDLLASAGADTGGRHPEDATSAIS